MRYKALLLALALALALGLSGCALTGPKTVATVTEPTIWEEAPSITQWAGK